MCRTTIGGLELTFPTRDINEKNSSFKSKQAKPVPARTGTVVAVVCLFTIFITSVPASFAVVSTGLTNWIGNPGFEIDLGSQVPNTLQNDSLNPFPGSIYLENWDNTSGRGLTTPQISGAPEGSRVLQLSEATLTDTAGSFTFQSYTGPLIGDGVYVSFSANPD